MRVGVVKAAAIGGLSSDPWPEQWFVGGVVLLDGLYDGAVVEVGEGGGDIYGQQGIVRAVVEEGLCELVEFFRTGGASYRVLVWFEGSGYCRGDVLGNGGGDDAAEDGAARNGANAAVGFE